jgi:heme A synthase
MVVEALIGAGIVVFGLVERNDSALRAAVIGLHLANTFVLLAFLALTALVATTGRQPKFKSLLRQPLEGLFYVGYACILVCIAAFGAIAALGNTLFPSASLIDGMVARSDNTAHFLERLTVVHPLLAIFGGLSLVGIVQVRLVTSKTAGRSAHLAAHVLTGLMLTNLVVGALDVALLAPMAVSTLHLLLADLIWLAFVWTAFEQATQSSASQTDAWLAPQEGKQMVEAKSPRPLTNPHGTP